MDLAGWHLGYWVLRQPCLLVIGSLGFCWAFRRFAALTWFMGLRSLTELYALGAHKRHLEESIATELCSQGYIFVPWDDAGGKLVRRSVANAATFLFYVLLALVVSVGSIVIAWRELPAKWNTLIFLDASTFALMAGIAIWSSWGTLTIYRRTLNLIGRTATPSQ
jgi:hypothetical protein